MKWLIEQIPVDCDSVELEVYTCRIFTNEQLEHFADNLTKLQLCLQETGCLTRIKRFDVRLHGLSAVDAEHLDSLFRSMSLVPTSFVLVFCHFRGDFRGDWSNCRIEEVYWHGYSTGDLGDEHGDKLVTSLLTMPTLKKAVFAASSSSFIQKIVT